MAKRAWVLVAVVAAVVAWGLWVPIGALAIHTNADCASCHGDDSLVSNALFDVGAVDKSTACRKCHLDSLVGAHPNHYAGGNCSAVCHATWGSSLAMHTPTVLEAEGAFASADSPDVPAFVLHAIHSNPRWMADVTTADSKCGSCHAVASCTACHNGSPSPDVSHGEHGSGIPTDTPITPWVGDVSVGVTALQSEDTKLEDYAVLCGASGCHDTSGIALSSPQFMDVYNIANAGLGFITPTISSTGTWRDLVNTACSLQREKYSNVTGSEYTLTFTGERVAVYGSMDQYRGVAEVLIDGSSVATFSAYSGPTLRQRPLWTSADLGAGSHTVTIRATGQKESLSRGTYVSIDHIAIYAAANDTIIPLCTSCHPTQADDDHGGEHPVVLTFSHDVTQTISASNTWNTGYGSYACNQCHQSALRTEHRRTTAAGYAVYPDSCAVCHASANPVLEATLSARRTPIPGTWTGTYDVATACSDPDFGTACHSVSSFPTSRERHTLVVSAHAANSSGESPACAGCHGSDLRIAHNNPIPGNTKVETNGCLACHGTTKLETNRTCSQGAAPCHSGGYGAISTHAVKDAASHVASGTGTPFTRAYQTSAGTDDGGVECAVCHSSQLVPAHSEAPATGCASGGAGGLGCHMDTAYNSIAVASSGWASRKCADCHDYGVKQTHDSTATAHLVGNNGCAGTGSGCHNSNDLWVLHLTDYYGTPRPDKGCNVTGCHDVVDDRPVVNFANSCGSTSTGCHTSYAPDHAANFSHSFSAVSYYNGASETGCTNQTGCHNQGVASTVDYGDDFHPASGCFSGACHTSPSKGAFTGILPTDCQECHRSSGGFTGAAARTNLTAAPAAGGHYSETTHTATGMTTALNAGGTASATCNNCHSATVGGSSNGLMNQHTSITIGGSPYGAALTCGECHGDTRAFGYAQVAANWTNNTCADCHTGGSSSPLDHASSVPAVAEAGSTCGSTGSGCHNTTDLHALHRNAPGGCNLTGCHIYTQQSQRPTAKGCGGATSCHSGYTNTSHGATTGNEATHTAPAMTTVLDAAYNAGGANTCATCHSSGLEAAHGASITGNLASPAWSSPMCDECHGGDTSPVTGAVNVIKTTKWPAKSCDECHGAPNGPAKHTEYASGHTGSSPGWTCASASCHGNTWDLRDLHNNPVTSNGSTAGCDSAGCHDAANKEMQSAAKTCGQGNSCHTDKTDSNHGAATAHPFTSGSYYSGAGETGCTNQPGCHNQTGSDTSNYADTYHPASGCQSGPCHTSASKAGYAGDGDCDTCHNANYTGAADRVPVNGAYPAGHYSETTHTAVGMTTAVTAGGTASATCNNCHSPTVGGAGNALANQHTQISIAGSPYGAALGCGECHGDVRARGLTEVTANWTNNTCADCHAGGTSSPLDHATTAAPVAEVTTTCGSTGINCHNTTDLHALHKNAAGGCNLTGCHVYTSQAAMPTAKSCGVGGTCHATYTKNTHAHAADAAKHQPTNTTQSAATQFGVQCGACHDIRNSNASLTLEHDLATSAKTGNANNCLNCHNNAASTTAVANNWSAKDTTSACSACHTGGLAIHADANSTAHADVTSSGCGNTGIGCHNSNDLSQVGAVTTVNTNIHSTCLRCHDRTATAPNMAYNPALDTCGSGRECHGVAGQYNTTTYVHNGATGAGLADGNDAAHHTDSVMTATMTSGVATATCANCHTGTLATSHANALTGWTNTCTSCHNSTLAGNVSANEVKAGWTNNDCGDCHVAGASAVKIPNLHSRYAAGTHDGTSPLGCGATGTNCHTTYDLAVLHGKTLTNGCQVTGCHDAVDKAMGAAAKSCGVGGTCHSTYTLNTHSHLLGGGDAAKHQPTTTTQSTATQFGVQCGACHDIRNSNASLTLEHDLATSAKTGNANNCLNCHNNAASTTAVANNWSAKDTTSACSACHTGGLAIHATANTAAHSTAANAGCASTGAGCHNGVDLSMVGPTDVINTNIHTSCLRCHDRVGTPSWSTALIGTAGNLLYNPNVKTCGQATGCHTSGSYNPVSGYHRIGRADVVDGNDAKHVDPSMTGTVGNGTNNTCASCHTSGLANSHSTTMTGWANTCTSCHNSALASNVAPTQVKAGWTGDDCSDCHTAGASSTKIPNWHSKWGTASHAGVPTGANTCSGACHIANYGTLDLAEIHEDEALGCKLAGCHAVDTPMTAASKSCGVGGACHTTYADGNHGFSVALHTTTDVNSWQNCGRCHLGYRADYTWNKTFNGHLQIDMQSPVGIDQLHRDPLRGGNGCPTCHDGGATQALIDAGATANCISCHVDHRDSFADDALYTTKSTSNTNLAKTMNINFTEMDFADFTYLLATADNANAANARLEIGPDGAEYVTTSTATTAMDPNRKKVEYRGLDVSSIEGTQPVRLYVWSGSSATTAVAEHFRGAVSRGDMVTKHSADVSAYTCGFGDCHTSNTLGWHEDYEIPGTFTGTYDFPTLPSKESLTTVSSGTTANVFTKVKSLTLNMADIDKIRLRLNLYCSSTTSTNLQWRVQVGSTIIASGNKTSTATTQYWWDYRPGFTDPNGVTLDYIDTTAYTGTTTFDLYLASSSTTTSRRARNSTMQIYAGTRIYNPGTPTDDCEICHQSTIRRDDYGNVQSNDQTLSPFAPKLTGIVATATPNTDLNPQCDTCHPAWETGHPQFSHRADANAETCLAGCHEFKPALTGTDLGYAKYDLTKQHMWGDNTNAGISYAASTTISTQAFTSAPATWTVSNATYVTNVTGGRSGNCEQIGVNTTRTEYNFYNTTAYDLTHWRGGAVQFWYQVNVGDTSDYLAVDYSTTTTAGWTELWRRDTDALTWTQSPMLYVPGDGPIYIRFRGTFDTTGEYGRVDDFSIAGASRTLPGTMEGGCASSANGACHGRSLPTSGKCSDCHASINHHNVIHDMSDGGTRTSGVQTGYAFNSCIGVCHVNNLHYAHGVALTETEPRLYRAPGASTDSVMTCATCHDSANATIKTTANSAATPIADQTLMCATCHTGTAGMASSVHATETAGTTLRAGSPLKGVSVINQFNNTMSVGGHRVPPFNRTWVATDYYWRSGVGWSTTTGTGYVRFQFNNHTAAPGATGAAALLRANTVNHTGAAGAPLKNGSTALSTSTVIACADCHGESAANLEGPQGAASSIDMYDAENFSTSWKTAVFISGQTAPPTLICSRCHNLSLDVSAALHNTNSGHSGTGTECVNCHIAVPHAWKRPKLLVSTTNDPAQYLYNPGTNTGSSLRSWNGGTGSGTASGTWGSSGNCSAAGCRSHSTSTNLVP